MKTNLSEICMSGNWVGEVEKILPWVFDQGITGTCWAAHAVAAVEALLKITHGVNIQLSVQEVVDCSNTNPDIISTGEDPLVALKYMKEEGVSTERQYPFTGVRKEYSEARLFAKKIHKAVRISSFERIVNITEKTLMDVVKCYPVMVSIFLVRSHFEKYTGGLYWDVLPYQPNFNLWPRVLKLLGVDLDLEDIEDDVFEGDVLVKGVDSDLDDKDVGDVLGEVLVNGSDKDSDLDQEEYDYKDIAGIHCVLIVGYATSNEGESFWIVRNSYGPKWGEKGYMLIPRALTPLFINAFFVTGVYPTVNLHLMELE